MAEKKQQKAEVKQISTIRRKMTNIDFDLRSPIIKGIAIFAAAMLGLTFVIHHVYVFVGSRNSFKTQTAVMRTITKSIPAEGIVLREEHLLSGAGIMGTVVPRVSNGSKVKSGDTVAEVFASAATAETVLEIDALSNEIAYYESIAQINSGNLLPNKDSYNQNISKSLFELLACISENRLSELNDSVMQLSLNATKKQIALGKPVNVDGVLSSLYEQKERLSAMVSSGSAVRADSAGYYVSNADGYENVYDYSGVLGITPAEVNSLIASNPLPVSNNMGKLITRFVWYIVCVVNKAEADYLSVGQKITVTVNSLSDENLKMTIAAKNEGEDEKVALVLKSYLMNSDIAALRLENIKIFLEEYSGYAVDKKALRTVDGNTGVYVQTGNTISFRKVNIIYSDDNIILADPESKDGYLRLYDQIITGGTDLGDRKFVN